MTKMIYDEDSYEWIDLDKIGPHSNPEDDAEIGYALLFFLIVFGVFKLIDLIIGKL